MSFKSFVLVWEPNHHLEHFFSMMKYVQNFKWLVNSELLEGGLFEVNSACIFKITFTSTSCLLRVLIILIVFSISTCGIDTNGENKCLAVIWHFLCAGH